MDSCVRLSENLKRKLEVLKPLITYFAGLEFDSDSKYIEFLLNLAIHKILNDILSDPESRLDLIKMIFRENPEIVIKNIITMLSEELEAPKRSERNTQPETPMHT